MALRKPLVIASGKIQQLQSGDTLDAGVTSYNTVSLKNSTSVATKIGQPVYVTSTGGYKQAIATAAVSAYVFGLQYDANINSGSAGYIQTDGIISATSAQWKVATSSSATLVTGTAYYLSTNIGKITTTAPTAVSRYVTFLGVATSTVTLDMSDMDKRGGILL